MASSKPAREITPEERRMMMIGGAVSVACALGGAIAFLITRNVAFVGGGVLASGMVAIAARISLKQSQKQSGSK